MSEKDFSQELKQAISDVCREQYVYTMFRDRPYDGQPWTVEGGRGQQEIKGITMRDLKDCYVKSCFLCSGLPETQYPATIYDLNWQEIDPLAVFQTMMCEIEKLMGIFPNVPKLTHG